jgi:hypothetical protein
MRRVGYGQIAPMLLIFRLGAHRNGHVWKKRGVDLKEKGVATVVSRQARATCEDQGPAGEEPLGARAAAVCWLRSSRWYHRKEEAILHWSGICSAWTSLSRLAREHHGDPEENTRAALQLKAPSSRRAKFDRRRWGA